MNKQKLAYKKLGNVSLFDNEETLDKLNSLGNPLERLSKVIDFEMFRDELEEGLYKERFTTVGAKPYDYVLMFKILVLQRMYHLSDEQTEYQIRDRLSFRDFLGLASGDRVPDARTIWVREENKLIKEGKGDELWNAEEGDTEDDKKHKANKKRHKDTDARWTKKGGEKFYGYKAHAKRRARMEHVFGYMEESMHGMHSRAVGFLRNAAQIIFTCLVYNMLRYEQIKRLDMN